MAVEPEDQKHIPHPRVGFAGVIDERMNIDLLGKIAELRPEIQFIMLGPVVKIDPATLPRHANIHYLGGKAYKELPAYLGGWDAAMLPFAHNESTRFISPTKTPEYLAAGKPVVSTSIRDVVRPYAALKLVRIADTAEEFAIETDAALNVDATDPVWAARRDDFLSKNSWDITFSRMNALIEQRLMAKEISSAAVNVPSRSLEAATLGD
jgi:UDP-galactopyranose mutase